ncbi:MAG: UDP-N-acetylmuramoyl-tripeptide--D-alanyl-D-alanine ligase [Candidatus Paceibacterota bacterium]
MIKEIFKKIIIAILTLESKAVLFRFKPKIIAITGNVGKTSTKDAIFTALSNNLKIRKNQKSFNSEIGTPLTILGLENAWNDPFLWIKNIFIGACVPFKNKYPEWLVLEVGVDRPGDIPRVAKWLKPNVVVITSLPKIPVHVEYFSSPDAVIKEKLSLINFLKKDGTLILNADDPLVFAAKEKFDGNVLTYGSDSTATVSYSNKNIIYMENDGVQLPAGISFKISHSGNSVPMSLPKVLGVQHILPVVASIAVGISQNVPFLDMVNSFAKFDPPKGRMNLILGKNNSIVIDDTYNAAPLAMQKAVEVLAEIETNGNKIAVLGDMLEIGQYSASEHKKIGEQVEKSKINLLITVGIRARSIAESAIESGMDQNSVYHFKDFKDVSTLVLSNLKPSTVVLVKGSQGIRLEKVVEDLISEDLNKTDLLVRQEKDWKNR